MIVCVHCRKEMKVVKNGVPCRWRGTHAYMGDLWECRECGFQVVNCNNNPCHHDKLKPDDLYMDDYLKEHPEMCPEGKTLDLRGKNGSILPRKLPREDKEIEAKLENVRRRLWNTLRA